MSLRMNWREIVRFLNPTAVTLLIASVLTIGCATSTRISTIPEGAKVSVNDRYLGESPVIFQDRSGFSETRWVKVEKPGYRTQNVAMRKSYRADESLVLILFGIIPYFFSARFEEQETFTLQQDR